MFFQFLVSILVHWTALLVSGPHFRSRSGWKHRKRKKFRNFFLFRCYQHFRFQIFPVFHFQETGFFCISSVFSIYFLNFSALNSAISQRPSTPIPFWLKTPEDEEVLELLPLPVLSARYYRYFNRIFDSISGKRIFLYLVFFQFLFSILVHWTALLVSGPQLRSRSGWKHRKRKKFRKSSCPKPPRISWSTPSWPSRPPGSTRSYGITTWSCACRSSGSRTFARPWPLRSSPTSCLRSTLPY